VKTQKLGDWAAAENLLKLKEKTKGDFQRGKGLGSTYISGSIHILGIWSLHLDNFCIFTVVGVLSQSVVLDFVRFSSNFN